MDKSHLEGTRVSQKGIVQHGHMDGKRCPVSSAAVDDSEFQPRAVGTLASLVLNNSNGGMHRLVPDWFPRQENSLAASNEAMPPNEAMSLVLPQLPLDCLVLIAAKVPIWSQFVSACKLWNGVLGQAEFWRALWALRWNMVPLFDEAPDLSDPAFWARAYKDMHHACMRCCMRPFTWPIPRATADVDPPSRIRLQWPGFVAHALNFPVYSGAWVYEVGVPKGEVAQIGWIVPEYCADSDRGDGVGDVDGGWGFDGVRQLFWHGGSTPWGENWTESETVGIAVRVDASAGTVAFEFFLDGRSLGIIPPELTMSPPASRGPFFPALSCTLQSLMDGDFEWMSSSDWQKKDGRIVNAGPSLRFTYGDYKPLASEQFAQFNACVASFPRSVAVGVT